MQADEAKQIIIEALKFRIAKRQFKICAFVIIPNHMHLIWRIAAGLQREAVQRDFLKFTAKELLAYLQKMHVALIDKSKVDAADRSFQVWKRDSMNIDLYPEKLFQQKQAYIHANPCQPKWQLVQTPADYAFSFAAFYETNNDRFDFLTHYTAIYTRWSATNGNGLQCMGF